MKTTIKLTLTALTALALAANAYATEPLTFKGYTIGQSLTACPAGTKEGNKSATGFHCVIGGGGGSYANHPVKHLVLSSHNGRLESASTMLKDPIASAEVLNALIRKYGQPHRVNASKGQFGWEFGDQSLWLDRDLVYFMNDKLPDFITDDSSDM